MLKREPDDRRPSTGVELRGAVRVPVQGVDVRLASLFGQLVNISGTGALVRVGGKLRMGSECPLVLSVEPEPVEIRIRVVRLIEPVSVEPGATLDRQGFAIGVMFIEPPLSAQRVIARLMSPHTSHTNGGVRLEQRIVGQIAIVKVTGDITLKNGGDVLLKDRLHSLIQQGHTNLLLDLSDVSSVDSAGLGTLAHAYASTSNRGGALKLLNVAMRVRDMLVAVGLLTLYDTYESEADALASFGSASQG